MMMGVMIKPCPGVCAGPLGLQQSFSGTVCCPVPIHTTAPDPVDCCPVLSGPPPPSQRLMMFRLLVHNRGPLAAMGPVS